MNQSQQPMKYLNRSEEEKVQLATELCEYLNDLLRHDAKSIHDLCEERVPCNTALADHPTVQVAAGTPNELAVGMLGILNGFVGVHEDNFGYIVAEYSDDERKIEKFRLAVPEDHRDYEPTEEIFS